MVGGFVYDLFNACQALFYVSVIILLYQKEKWRHRLHYFYEVGRMGLTTYLMQTLKEGELAVIAAYRECDSF